MKSEVTTAITLDRRARKDGTRSVQLRITFQREQKYYSLGLAMTKEEFKKTMAPRPRGQHKENKLYFLDKEQHAIDILNRMHTFSFAEFKKQFLAGKRKRTCAFETFEDVIGDLQREGRAGTADTYRYAMKSFKGYHGKGKLRFEEITPEYLREYENAMLNAGRSKTTIGIYMRSLRTIYNRAIAEKVISREYYPFGKYGYKIPASRNTKKALNLREIALIFNYESAPGTTEEFCRDIWLFSYLCNGINIKDIARLKWENVDRNSIEFVRSKTERTTVQNLKPIVAHLLPEAKEILEKWGNEDRNPEDYVFPVLEPECSPERELALVRQFTKQVNKYMKRIAEACGIEQKVTTYTARHSFATVLKRSNTSKEFISEALGHKDMKTTENYLDSFADEQRAETAKALVAF